MPIVRVMSKPMKAKVAPVANTQKKEGQEKGPMKKKSTLEVTQPENSRINY